MPLRSNGIRPHVYDMPNEDNPLNRQYKGIKKTYQDEHLYYYTPGQKTLARSYVNYKGNDISDETTGYDTAKEFRDHNFKTLQAMLNALERNKVVAKVTGDAIYAERQWGSNLDYGEVNQKAQKYQAWKDREIYRVDWVEDDSVEGIADPVYHKGKRTEPAGKVKRSNKIFGRSNIDKAVTRERDNIRDIASRTYNVSKYSTTIFWDVPHNKAVLLGFDGSDMRIGETKDLPCSIDGRNLRFKRVG